MQFIGNFNECELFVGADVGYQNGYLIVPTPDGPLYALPYDWIIRTPSGRLRVCEASVFASVFER